MFKITATNPVHNCNQVVHKNGHANKRWVAEIYQGETETKRFYRPMHLREDVHLDHGVKIDYLVAERAKDNASKKIDGSDIDGFAKIPAYIRSIKAHNPNSHAVDFGTVAHCLHSMELTPNQDIRGCY
ncbi:hypothetical protein V1507DRAFT_437809 [Lipomyces tetrasporus]